MMQHRHALTAVNGEHAGEAVDGGALAGAVGAQQAEALACGWKGGAGG